MSSAADALIEQYLAGYRQLLDFIELGGANHGQVIAAILGSCGLEEGEPYCAATCAYVGHRSFMTINPTTRERKSHWPLPMTASCAQLAAAADKAGVLMKRPQRGDLFVKWFPSLKRFAHAGVIDTVVAGADTTTPTCLTYEANTTAEPGDPYLPKPPANAKQDEREGWVITVKHRAFTPKDRFIRWVNRLV